MHYTFVNQNRKGMYMKGNLENESGCIYTGEIK